MAFCKAVELRARLSGHLDMTLRVEHVNIQSGLDEARKRTLNWNDNRRLESAVVDPFGVSRL
jgi:hypothetical protein